MTPAEPDTDHPTPTLDLASADPAEALDLTLVSLHERLGHEQDEETVVTAEQTVRADVDLLRSSTILPATITVSGHVYDVDTGLITTVVPAEPMSTGATPASA